MSFKKLSLVKKIFAKFVYSNIHVKYNALPWNFNSYRKDIFYFYVKFRIMDDFDSGQSSLNGLNLMHFTVVKLDKSLIDFIGQKSGDLILNYAMALGKELGVQLVAEGVENAKQLTFLRNNHCDVIQGYYFSKPLPVEEFESKLDEKA